MQLGQHSQQVLLPNNHARPACGTWKRSSCTAASSSAFVTVMGCACTCMAQHKWRQAETAEPRQQVAACTHGHFE